MTMGNDLSGGGLRQSQWVKQVGRNAAVAATTAEDIWEVGGTYANGYLSTASVLEIVSSSANDAAAGTGARTVRVYGLDANWDLQTVDVTLNGTSAVDLSGTWMRVWRIRLLTAGSGALPAGNLTLRVDGGGSTVAQLQTAQSSTTMALFTVPRRHTLHLTQWATSYSQEVVLLTSGLPVASYGITRLMVRYPNGDFAAEDELAIWAQQPGGRVRTYSQPLVIPAQADVKLRYFPVADIADEGVAGFFEGYLLPAS